LRNILPKIVNIKGIYKTVGDAISQLEYDPSVNQTAKSLYDKSQKGLKMQPETKTGWQSQHQQT
jgi:hypothetical protein